MPPPDPPQHRPVPAPPARTAPGPRPDGPRARALGLAGALAALLGSACASKPTATIYVHPSADLWAFERVAVLPIENMTTDRFAGEKVRELLALELAALGAFDVLELGEVNRVLRTQNIQDVTILGPEQVQQLGTALGVQGLLFGAVMEYREQRTGNITSPDVALALRLIDVESGIVVWSVGDAERGMGIWTRLFGVGGESQTEAVRALVRDLMHNLYAAA